MNINPYLLQPEDPFGQNPRQEQNPAGYINPKNALWGGIIMDIGNFIAAKGMQPMQGLGPKYMFAANQQNEILRQVRYDGVTGAEGQDPAIVKEFQFARENGFTGSFLEYMQTRRVGGRNPDNWTPESWQMYEQTGDDSVLQPQQRIGSSTLLERLAAETGMSVIDLTRLLEKQKTLGGGEGETDANLQREGVRAAAIELPQLHDKLDSTRDLIAAFKAGEYDGKTGIFRGRWKSLNDPKTAALQAESVIQLLNNLQITKLTPITEKEMEVVATFWADVKQGKEVNIGRLEAVEKFLERAIREMELVIGADPTGRAKSLYEDRMQLYRKSKGSTGSDVDDDIASQLGG